MWTENFPDTKDRSKVLVGFWKYDSFKVTEDRVRTKDNTRDSRVGCLPFIPYCSISGLFHSKGPVC